jgi:gas vesicle protein
MRHHGDEEAYVIIERNSGSVGSFLMGIAIGAGIALLMAPQSGPETRRRIRVRARRVSDSAVGLAQDVTGTVADSFADARRRVEDRIDSAREAIEFKRQQVTRAMEAGRVAAQQAREELERRLAETKAAYQAGADVARDSRVTGGVRAGRTVPVTGGRVVVTGDEAARPRVATSAPSREPAGGASPSPAGQGQKGELGPTGTDETNVEL